MDSKTSEKGKLEIGPKDTVAIDNKVEPITVKERMKYVILMKEREVGLDAVYTAECSETGRTIIFWIQYKKKVNPSTTEKQQTQVSPSVWWNHISTPIREAYSDTINYFVFVTDANITKTKRSNATRKCENLLIIDQECLPSYVSPNILLYYCTIALQVRSFTHIYFLLL
jgi:hypothetical protein